MPAPESEMTDMACDLLNKVFGKDPREWPKAVKGTAKFLAAAHAQGKAEGRAEAARDFAEKFGRAPASSKE